jgi:hypothetical protein
VDRYIVQEAVTKQTPHKKKGETKQKQNTKQQKKQNTTKHTNSRQQTAKVTGLPIQHRQ